MRINIPVFESFRMSFNALRQNRLRSLLSVLGITIGIFCIVSVYALVHSLERSLNNQFSKFGADVLFVQKWPWDDFGNNYPWWKFLKRPITKPEEADFLEGRMPKDKVTAIAYTFSSNLNLKFKETALQNISIKCISHDFSIIQDVDISDGRYFTPEESRNGRGVVIIGGNIAEQLFKGDNPIGKEIRVGSALAKVVGVCAKQGSSMIGNSSDDIVYAPSKWGIAFMSYRFSEDAQVMVKAKQDVSLEDLRIDVARLMRQYRRLKPGEEENFAVNKMSMITDAISSLFKQIRLIGIIIGGFAMVVGCFGVANIMFVSVKERTREIGIQKALGAKNWFISSQFLLESVWLSIAGGVIGLLIVAGVMALLDVIAKQSMGSDIQLSLMFDDAMLGVVTSVVVGLVAGFLPARSAANLNPVEAIRSN